MLQTELRKEIKDNIDNLKLASNKIDFTKLTSNVEEYMRIVDQPGFWNRDNASSISQRLALIKNQLAEWKMVNSELNNLYKLCEENIEGTDLEYLNSEMAALYPRIQQLIITSNFNKEYDHLNAIITITAGVGGVDAMDWAMIVKDMYIKFANSNGFTASEFDISYGEEAGIKTAKLNIAGEYAYGWLRLESGVHRLVRKSPFNSAGLRQTSFALVEVAPDIEDIDLILDMKDIRIDRFKSSGSGGQSVNTTDSAIRIMHIPSGIIVTIQDEKSQAKNKKKALAILYSKLLKLAEQQQENDLSKLKTQNESASWGQQIRSYVMHPYKMIKDHRTDYKINDVDAALDGDLIEMLRYNISRV